MEKIIHYCWFGNNDMPELALKCIDSWKKFFPDYKIIKWSEENFDINCNQYVYEAYKSKKYAFVSDYVRLKVIYEYGGIYFDTDVEVIKKFDDSMINYGYLGLEGKLINTGLGFAAPKKSKVVKIMLDEYENLHFIKKDGSLDLTACPKRNTNSLREKGYIVRKNSVIEGIKVYANEYFNPYNYDTGELKITKNTYSIHRCAASWISKERKNYSKHKILYISKYGKFLGIIRYYIYRILKK